VATAKPAASLNSAEVNWMPFNKTIQTRSQFTQPVSQLL
jgi:hypothetical protein